MDSGQMLLWHVVLMPLVLVRLVALHVLFVRYRGVVHPFPAKQGRDALGERVDAVPQKLTAKAAKAADAKEWRGTLPSLRHHPRGVAASQWSASWS